MPDIDPKSKDELPYKNVDHGLAHMLYASKGATPSSQSVGFGSASFMDEYNSLRKERLRLLRIKNLSWKLNHQIDLNHQEKLHEFQKRVITLDNNLSEAYSEASSNPEFEGAKEPLLKQIVMARAYLGAGTLHYTDLLKGSISVGGEDVDIKSLNISIPSTAQIFRNPEELRNLMQHYYNDPLIRRFEPATQRNIKDTYWAYLDEITDEKDKKTFKEVFTNSFNAFSEKVESKGHLKYPQGITSDDIFKWMEDRNSRNTFPWDGSNEFTAGEKVMNDVLKYSLINTSDINFGAKYAYEQKREVAKQTFDALSEFVPQLKNGTEGRDFLFNSLNLMELTTPVLEVENGKYKGGFSSGFLSVERDAAERKRHTLLQIMQDWGDRPLGGYQRSLMKSGLEIEGKQIEDDDIIDTPPWDFMQEYATYKASDESSWTDEYQKVLTTINSLKLGQIQQAEKSPADVWADEFQARNRSYRQGVTRKGSLLRKNNESKYSYLEDTNENVTRALAYEATLGEELQKQLKQNPLAQATFSKHTDNLVTDLSPDTVSAISMPTGPEGNAAKMGFSKDAIRKATPTDVNVLQAEVDTSPEAVAASLGKTVEEAKQDIEEPKDSVTARRVLRQGDKR